jgi:hypothetical protein
LQNAIDIQSGFLAFPVEAQEALSEEHPPMDAGDDDDAGNTAGDTEVAEILDRERDLLDAIPLPGVPDDEKERRKRWLELPPNVRAAIRKLHRQFGHPARSVLSQIMRAGRAPPAHIAALRFFHCEACKDSAPMPQTTKVSLPRDYSFNREVGVDVLEAKDSEGNPYLLLNIICLGTSFQQCVPIRPGVGQPTSSECLDAFLNRWVSWAGWPVGLKCDRGLHNRGRFAKTLTEHGVIVRQAGVEAPYQIGKVERHGDIFKSMLKKTVKDKIGDLDSLASNMFLPLCAPQRTR